MDLVLVYHKLDMKLKLMSQGQKRSKDFKVAPLSEEEAITTGAEMLSEAFVFFVGAGMYPKGCSFHLQRYVLSH